MIKKISKKAQTVVPRKKSEDFENRYRNLIKITSDWIWEINNNGKYCYCSEKIEQILGYTSEEVYGKSPFDFMQPDEAERVSAIFKKIMESHAPIIDLENWNVHKDGHKVCLVTNGVPLLDQTGAIIGFFGIDKDITERKLAEEALKKSEERWHYALEGSGDGVWDWNSQTDNVFFSHQWKAMLGYTDDEIGSSLHEWRKRLHPDDEKSVHEHLIRFLNNETPTYHNEHRVQCKDGSYKWVLDRGKIFEWSQDGTPLRVIGTHTDITERKRIETLLKKNELTFRTIADYAYDWEYWNSEDHQIIYMSPSCERITGYTPEEFIADPTLLQTIVHPDDIDNFGHHHTEAFTPEHQTIYNEFDVRIRHKNGSTVIIQHICRPIFDENKKYLGRRVSNRDITERKKTDEILHQLSQAVEQSPVSIVITDTSGSIKYVNPKFIDVTGYSFREAMEQNPRILKSGYTSQEEYEQLWNTLNAGKEWTGEFHNRKKNGDLYWESANISPIIDGDGKISHFLAVKQDITALKKSETSKQILYEISGAAHSAESLHDLFAAVHKGFCELLPAKNFFIAIINEPDRSISFPYGFDEKSIDLKKTIDLDDTKSLTIEVIKTQKSLLLGENELNERYASGKNQLWGSIPKCWLGVPLILKGKSIGTFVLQDYNNENAYNVNDIALLEAAGNQIALAIERKQSEESLVRFNQELIKAYETVEAASKLKSEFVANMSHEIRTPINGIMGLTDLVLQTEITEEQQSYLELIKSSSASLMTIINEILDFSKIESGKLTLERIEFNLHDVIEETIALLRNLAVEKGIALQLNYLPGTSTSFIGDPHRIRQVMTNLTGNAIKFTEHGSITIEVSKKESYDDSSVIHFSITDTGIGIPESAIDKIFQPFVQANGSTTREYGGTGLGLAISKQMVELMGGTIGIHSTANVGSTVWFTATLLNVPKRISEENGIAEVNGIHDISGSIRDIDKKQIRILIAEDNIINQKVCKGMLDKLGYSATIVCNGLEAHEELNRQPYDIVLMDCQMPVMDGFEATKLIRDRQNVGNRVPIIAMTANAFQSDKENCIAAGMDGYFSKPFTQKELGEIIEQWAVQKHKSMSNALSPIISQSSSVVSEYLMIDKNMIDDIVDADIMDTVLLQDLLKEYFSTDIPCQIQSIRDSYQVDDLFEMRRMAHSLRGSSGQLGAFVASKLCEDIETCVVNNNLQDIPTKLDSLEQIFNSTKIEFDDYLRNKKH